MSPSETLIDTLLATAEICGAVMSKPTARLMAEDLANYPEQQVLGAMRKCRQEVTGRLTLAAILTRLDDGRPGSEEAWATMPKDEYSSAVLTQEQLTAWGIAHDLHESDPIAARMAFKEAYTRLVSESRAARTPAQWHVSLGDEKTGRASALQEAALAGKVSSAFAVMHCPIEHLPQVEAALGLKQLYRLLMPKRDVKTIISGVLSGKVVTD